MANEFVFETKIEIKIDPRWKGIASQLEDIIQIAARNIEGRAKKLVPYDTGATSNSIQARPAGDMEWRIGPTTEYAPFLEFGTVRMKERPFMVPSSEHEKPRVRKAIMEMLKKLES